MDGQAGYEAARSAAEEMRGVIRAEVEAARKSGQAGRWLPILGSLVAALIGAAGSYVAALSQAEVQLRDSAAKLQAQQEAAAAEFRRLAEQNRMAADLTAYQKLFDGVMGAEQHEKLQRALAVIVLADLVEGPRFDGICRYLVSLNLDARPREDDPNPTKIACRQAAGTILNPARGERPVAAVVAASRYAALPAAPPSTATPPEIMRVLQRQIAALDSDAAAERLNAARLLSVTLNGSDRPLPDRIALFAALVAASDPDGLARLSPNGRYNLFVVLSEIRPLIDAARDDPGFRSASALLRGNAQRLLASPDTDLAGAATRRQVQQTLDRLPPG